MQRSYEVSPVHSRDVAADETVLIEPVTQQAHILRGALAETWRGLRDGVEPEGREAELDALQDLGLVVQQGLSRRSFVLRTGAAVAAGAVATLALPSVAAAASTDLTTTLLSSSPTTPSTGAPYTLTAQVSRVTTSDPVPLTGTVTLYRRTLPAGAVVVDSQPVPTNGIVDFHVIAGAAGVPQNYYAVYAGDAHYQPSTSADVVVVPSPL